MKRYNVLVAVGLVVLVMAWGWSALDGEFVYDDRDLISQNAYLLQWVSGESGPEGGGGSRFWTLLTSDFAEICSRSQEMGAIGPINYYRPVITLSYLVDAWFWSRVERGADGRVTAVALNPVGFRLTNLMWHTLNSILVYVLARSLVRNARIGALAAILFAVHPVHTESVCWISGRTDVIATTFFLAAFWAYVRFRRSGRGLPCAAAVALLVLGTFAKEMVATLGPILVLYELLVHVQARGRAGGKGHDDPKAARPGEPGPGLGRRLSATLPFFLAVAPYFLVKALLASGRPIQDHWGDVGIATILFSFARAATWYLGKVLWPWPLDVYPMLPFATAAQGFAFGLLHLAVLGVIVIVVIRGKSLAFGLAGLGFYLSLAPLSSIVPGARLLRYTEDMDFPVSERFLYLPSFFAVLGLAWVLVTLSRRLGRAGPWAGGGLVVVLVGLGIGASTVRGLDWRSNLSLYSRAAELSPHSVRMHSNLGLELMEAYRFEEARAALIRCLRLQEERFARDSYRRGVDPYAYNNLGRLYLFQGDLPEAMRYYQASVKSVADQPRSPAHLNNYAFAASIVAMLETNRALVQESLRAYRKAAAMSDPPSAVVREMSEFLAQVDHWWKLYFDQNRREDDVAVNVAGSFAVSARRCLAVGRPEQALTMLVKGLAVLPPLDPGTYPRTTEFVLAMRQLGRTALETGRNRYGARLRRWPDRPALLFLRGEVERQAAALGLDGASCERAVRDLERALAIAPDRTYIARSLAACLLAGGDEARAVQVVEAAALARARSNWPLWPTTAAQAAIRARERFGAKTRDRAAWTRMVDRVLEAVAERLEREAGQDAYQWNDLGYIRVQQAHHLGQTARYEEAVTCFRRALDLDPELVNAAGSLVHTLSRMGRTGEAEQVRQAMRLRFPEHPFFRNQGAR